MKKTISLILVVILLLSATQVAFATTEDWEEGTLITLQGSRTEESYSVTIPATMSPGETGVVSARGEWGSHQKLIISCPDYVELTYGDKTMEVAILFDGVEMFGDDLNESMIEAEITVDEAYALFGTWTGILTYDVEILTNSEDDNLISFQMNGKTYYSEKDMLVWDWLDSEYNTDGYYLYEDSSSWFTTDELLVQRKGLNVYANFFHGEDTGCFENGTYPITSFNTFTFTIDGKTYYADYECEGDEFDGWVDLIYNTDGWYILEKETQISEAEFGTDYYLTKDGVRGVYLNEDGGWSPPNFDIHIDGEYTTVVIPS